MRRFAASAHIKRAQRHLRHRSGRVEVGQEAIHSTLRKTKPLPERLVRRPLGVNVSEEFQVFADQKQVDQLLVHDLKTSGSLMSPGVENSKFQSSLVAGFENAWCMPNLHFEFDAIRYPED